MTNDARIATVENRFVATVGRRRTPRFWTDVGVRRLLIVQHTFSTLDQARSAIVAEFGDARAPGRSSINRFWQALDSFWKVAK